MPAQKKPTALKILQGTARADRINADEPTPDVDIPKMPTHLSKEAGAEWRRITPLLKEHGLISKMDMACLAMYCTFWGDHVKAENMLRKSELVIKTPNGSQQISPWVSISKHAMLAAHKMLTEFGLTPASRTKVSAKTPEKKKDTKGRFFKNG